MQEPGAQFSPLHPVSNVTTAKKAVFLSGLMNVFTENETASVRGAKYFIAS